MKKGNRILAFFMAVILIITAIELPAWAATVDVADGNNFKPQQPTVVSAEGQMQISGVNVESDSIQIQASQSTNEFTLVLELLTDGGVHFYDESNHNTMFQDNIDGLKDTITTTQGTGIVTATGTVSGVRAVLDYTDANAWTLQIYKKESDVAAYTIDANELLVQYDSAERTNVSLCGEIASGEQFIGLGERYTGTILNGKTYPLWNEDGWSAGLNGDKTTSYANVPLLHSSNGYSLFFNSFYSATADIGSEENPDTYQFDFDGPDLDVFLWTGTPLENVKSYMSVTGTTVTIPKWATGYWAGGNTNNYWYNIAKKYYDADTSKADTAVVSDYYDEAMREVLQNYEDMGTVPSAVFGESTPTRALDAVSAVSSEFGVELLGWYHPDQAWDADEYRMINQKVLTSLKGFTATDELPLIKTASGEYYTYTNDGGQSEWNRVDYTHSNAGKLVAANLTRGWNKDLSGLMVDYGEYINADWTFANGMTGKEMHNLQAYYYNSVMKNAWDASSKAGDYILFARAGSAGSQSFAAQFGGDQKCNFEGLRQAVMGGLSASASGFGIWGSDIGGLGAGITESESNPLLTAELYMRWLGFGTFSTLMRTHGSMDHDPWTFAEEVEAEELDVDVEDVFQKYYWTRENLSDAIYSATLQSNKDGTPVMQVMGLAYPEYFSVGDQYLFCNEMLVAPVYEEGNMAINGTVNKSITLPEGKWYDLWSGKCIEGNGTEITVEVAVDETPVYLRSGSIMPVDLSAKTFEIADSMEDGNSVQALLVTPAEEGKSHISTWYIGEDENAPAFTYTSQTVAGEYTIRAEQAADNPKVLRGYGIKASNVSVDGVQMTRLYHEPIGTEIGFYVNEGTGEMVLALADGNWEEITFHDAVEVEYDNIDFANIDLASLDEKGFTSTQFSKSDYSIVGEANQPIAAHWFSGNGEGTPYVTRKGETGVSIWYSNPNTGIKPLSANKDSTLTLLNTPYKFENFQISTEICYGYSTGMVLGPENVYPTAETSSAIRIYFANGRVQLVGALDNSTAKASDETSWSTSGTTGLFLAKNTLSSNTTYTLHVKMENGVLTIWVDGCDAILTIEAADHYEAGSIALMASKFDQDGGGFMSLEIQKLDEEFVNFENLNMTELSSRGFTSTQFDKDAEYAVVGGVNQPVETHWFTGKTMTTSDETTLTSGNIGLKPMAADADRKAQLLNTPYTYKNFKISTEIYWGVNAGVVFGAENVYPRNTSDYSAISVYFANNRVQLGGALDYSTAEVIGKENGWTTYSTTGIFYFTDSFTATKNEVYTLNVEMQDGVLTVWVDGYPGVLTVETADHYETESIALMAHKYDGDGGGFKSFAIENLNDGYVNFDSITTSELEAEGFTSTQFDKDNSYTIVGAEDQAVSEHWFTGTSTITSDGTTLTSGNKGIKPLASDADRKAQFLNTPYAYENFKISTEIYWGVTSGVVFGARNVYPRNTSDYATISVYFANNRVQLAGAINHDTAEVTGKEDGWQPSGETGVFYFTDGFTATKNAVYTLNIEMQNGVLTVWVDGYPGVLTVETAEHYETGTIAFMGHKYDGDGGGIKSFTIDEIRTHYEEYTATEFASHREGTCLTAPTCEDYLFAGWFYDEWGKEAVQSNVTTTERTVYAKFVPKNILTVKAQISSNLLDSDTTNDTSASIRFVTTADTLRYKEIGFKISYDKGNGVQNRESVSKTVYTRLYAVMGDASGGTIAYDPTEFSQASTYFKACTVRGIGEALYDMTFTVTPFWTTLDGTEVCGETVERTVRQGIE